MKLIDGIGPFFRHIKSGRINWSKIPFYSLETECGLTDEVFAQIKDDFRIFVEKAATYGYTGVTLDDVAHLITSEHYTTDLNQKICRYQNLFRDLIQIATHAKLRVYITTDIIYSTEGLLQHLKQDTKSLCQWLTQQFEKLLDQFSEIAGVIARFGEKDGVDVQGDFRSQLLLKKPADIRTLLACTLPAFERRNKLFIFRTWSVGAYQVGDIIWNERTFRRVFDPFDSPSLIISMKYGESDFFRYLPSNPLFFASDHRKIVEFQARREYEGFGAYPSFIGWDCESHMAELRKAKNLVGCSVWCQTGGWGKLRQLTFVRNSSPWVEINTFVIPQIFDGATCDNAIDEFRSRFWSQVEQGDLIEFLKLSDDAIKNLLYVREFAERRLFFRRLRLPPQIYVFWDRVIVDHNLKRIFSCLVLDREAALKQGRDGLNKVRQMMELAAKADIPKKGLKFQLATFEILAAAREYFFQSYRPEIAEHILSLKKTYKKKFARNYSIRTNFEPTPIRKLHVKWLLGIMLRSKSKYRLVDQLITLRLLAWVYPLLKRMDFQVGPKFAHKQAMGIDTLFK